MKSSSILKILDGSGEIFIDDDVTAKYAGDLPSEVLGEKDKIDVWFTIRNGINVIAVAVAKGIKTIVFCNTETIPLDTLEAAVKNRVNFIIVKTNVYQSIEKLIKIGG